MSSPPPIHSMGRGIYGTTQPQPSRSLRISTELQSFVSSFSVRCGLQGHSGIYANETSTGMGHAQGIWLLHSASCWGAKPLPSKSKQVRTIFYGRMVYRNELLINWWPYGCCEHVSERIGQSSRSPSCYIVDRNLVGDTPECISTGGNVQPV